MEEAGLLRVFYILALSAGFATSFMVNILFVVMQPKEVIFNF